LISVFTNCCGGFDIETLHVVHYGALAGIISGGANKVAQAGAAHCFYELFGHFKAKGLNDLLASLAPKFVSLFVVLIVW
jgi:hypothetical protein